MKTLDISGSWLYKTDYDDCGIQKQFYKEHFTDSGFMLPGSACENCIGIKQEYYEELTKEAVRAPREKYEYLAPLWLQKEIDVPAEFEGKNLKLYLERVNIASELCIDGEQIGRQIIEISAPHIYNLTNKLTAGKHTLTLRIDNRNLLNLSAMESGYSIDTQGYWNGIIGKLELRCEELYHIEGIQVYPKDGGIDVSLIEICGTHAPFGTKTSQLTLFVTTPSGKKLAPKSFTKKLYNTRQVEHLSYEFDDIEYWSEFNPVLYTLTVQFACDEYTDEKNVLFGMRTIKSENKLLLLNEKPISLRGTIDCALFPLTGYPPMDTETWLKNFKTIQSYGLNHVRFHAWCPPEAAFVAADELGIYLSVEMPLWVNHDVSKLELGDDTIHRQYFTLEALTISKTYGNHPSFIMFSNGNENLGDFELLEDITCQIKACDNRRLYTLTSNFDHPVAPCEDYLCAFEASGHRVRIQVFHEQISQSTCLDYQIAVEDTPVPVISFEVGQYCVYPDVDIIEKYTGNMLPVNFDVIRKHMKKTGVYDRLPEYIKASGDLAVKLYKEDIEAALRTKNMGGFELLSLSDYTGQSTATVGILDVFLESKGLIEPEQFRNFCDSFVPLLRAKRIFKNTDVFEAEFDLYDYSDKNVEAPVYKFEMYNGNKLFYELETTQTHVEVPLNKLNKSALLNVKLTVNGHTNSWRIFVYADDTQDQNTPDIKLIKNIDDLKSIAASGGYAIITPDIISEPIGGNFVPVFWSPVHFPSNRPCGAVIDNTHAVFDEFPTEKYPDYQWKKLLDSSKGVDISAFGKEFKPIVETIPNFVSNIPSSPLFEMKLGKAKLVYCGFDLSDTTTEVAAFKNALYTYIASDKFNPAYEMNKDMHELVHA